MTVYTTYDANGEKESFEDYISNISPTDTRFTAITGEKSINNTTHQWQEDVLDAVGANARVEGWTAAATSKTPTVLRDNITQIFGKDGSVTDSNNAQDKYGRSKELIYQKTKDVMALKRDIEYAYVGTGQTRVIGDNSTAREMDGIQAQIDAGSKTDAVGGALTEAMVQGAAETAFNEGGMIDVLMANQVFASTIAGFSGKSVATNSVDGSNRIENSSTKVNGYVDVYVTQLGQSLAVEYNRFIRDSDVLLLDTSKVKRLTYRALRTVDVAKTGSSSPYFVEAECSLMNLNQKAHSLVINAIPA